MDLELARRRLISLNLLFCLLVMLTQVLFSSYVRAAELSKIPLNVQLTEKERNYLQLKSKLIHCESVNWMPYSGVQNGMHVGITADYMRLFEHTLGVKFEFMPTKTWLEAYEMVKARKCDFSAALIDQKSRHEFLDFTQGYIDASLSLATVTNAPNLENIKALDGKVIAIMKGYVATTFIRKNFPNIEILEVNSIDQGLKLVAEHKVYGVAGALGVLAYKIQNHYYKQLKINGTFADTWKPSVASRKDEPILGDIMNKVVDAIPQSLHEKVFQHWLSSSVIETKGNELTLKELDFISNHPTIRFRTRSNRAPFEYVVNGEVRGLAIDYLKLIAQRMGFNAEFVVMDAPPNEVVQEIQKQTPIFDTMTYWVKSKKRKDLLIFGDTYLVFPMVIIGNKKDHYITSLADLNHHTVVVEKGFLTNKWLARDYPNINVVNADNSLEAIKMINSGEVDAYVGNLAVANFQIANGDMENIKVAAPTEYGNIHYSFVAPNKWPELASILSKGYRTLTPIEHTALRERWFTLQTIHKTDYTLLIQVLVVAAALLTVSVAWSRRVNREKRFTEDALEKLQQLQNSLELKNAELKELSITDVLTGLNNRAKIESILSEQIRSANRYPDYIFGVIMLDLDKFKSINDTQGHQAGDYVLQGVSSLFKRHIRETDYIGRWGGEEFLIVCPHTSSNGVIKMAENLRQLVELHQNDAGQTITASFGVATYVKGDTKETILLRADQALYISKEVRNRVTYKR